MEIVCANDECKKSFEPKIHNAKYCSQECRQAITNKRVLARYYEKKEIKKRNSSEKRVCTSDGCDIVLSRYNADKLCERHKKLKLESKLKKWGWSDDAIKEFDLI